jgi:hypothetical protein
MHSQRKQKNIYTHTLENTAKISVNSLNSSSAKYTGLLWTLSCSSERISHDDMRTGGAPSWQNSAEDTSLHHQWDREQSINTTEHINKDTVNTIRGPNNYYISFSPYGERNFQHAATGTRSAARRQLGRGLQRGSACQLCLPSRLTVLYVQRSGCPLATSSSG